MQITLTITEDQLDSLKDTVKEKPELEAVYLQLMGYWMVGE